MSYIIFLIQTKVFTLYHKISFHFNVSDGDFMLVDSSGIERTNTRSSSISTKFVVTRIYVVAFIKRLLTSTNLSKHSFI